MVTKRIDDATQQIKELLADRYLPAHPQADIEVYRYNPVSIRIRIVDTDFEGKSIPQRSRAVWKLLKALPEDVRADISVCLLITPNEQSSSPMNLEFEKPSRSML
jgi:stress-induced morphogen